ncbi:MAG: globin domain-containing protein [Pikeienuella sp.]
MQLTDQELAIVRESFDRLRDQKAHRDPFGEIFYPKLFAKMPQARDLFRADLSEQGMRFLSTLGVIVDSLDAPAEHAEALERLAQGHAAYGVKAEHYEPMGEALREALAEWLGARYSPELDAAWAKAYDEIAARLQAATPAPGA